MGINTKLIVKIGLIPDLSIFSDIIEVIVDSSVFMPGMCTITFEERLPDGVGLYPHIDNQLKYQIGESVSIVAVTEKLGLNPLPKSGIIFNGEITSIEPIFEKSGRATLRIRALDKRHHLTKGKKFRTFSMVTDSAIIQKILLEDGIVGAVNMERLTTFYTNVIQYDQSDWDFLWDRAQLFGYQMYMDELSILHFEPVGIPHGLPIELSWGEDLVQFEPRLVSMGQVTQVKVGGWDANIKKGIQMTLPTLANVPIDIIGDPLIGPLADSKAFGRSTDFSVDIPMANIAEATNAAQGMVASHANQYIRANGELNTCIPTLLAGATLLVKNVGIRFGGTYYVSEAKHIYRNGDYRITFQVTGHNPYTIRHLLNGGELGENKISGVVIGVVTNVQDPLMMGRVKVKYPWIPSFPEVGSDWARIASIGSGGSGGMMFLPEVNDEVLVAFEHGDINFPYIVGLLWNGIDRPPQGKGPAVVAGKVTQRVIRSRSGHTIILDDTTGKEQIIIQDKTSLNSITFDSSLNAMTIKAQGDLTIEAGGKLTLKSNAGISATSQTTLELKANTIAKVEAGPGALEVGQAGSSIKGLKVDIQASTQASIQGTAMVSIQGGLVKIN